MVAFIVCGFGLCWIVFDIAVCCLVWFDFGLLLVLVDAWAVGLVCLLDTYLVSVVFGGF